MFHVALRAFQLQPIRTGIVTLSASPFDVTASGPARPSPVASEGFTIGTVK